MLTEILIVLAIIVAALAVFIATRPGEFTVTRTGRMTAPPNVVFDLVNNFREWMHWSPWEKKDPNLGRTYEGPDAGVGAVYRWRGDKNVGEGMMRIEESLPGELIRIHLEFIKPFKAVNVTTFEFTPEGEKTTVVWTMRGTNNFIGKTMSVFMNFDKMIGADFEKGLAVMRTEAEKRSGVRV